MEISGKVENILPVESGVSKVNKEWKKQSFVINTGDQYNPLVCFGVFGDDKLAMVANLSVGDEVNVHFNLSSRDFNGKWYHNIDAWKIEPSDGITNQKQAMPSGDGQIPDKDDEELPF